MPRNPLPCTKAHLKRLLEAAVEANFPIACVRVTRDGAVDLIPGTPPANPLASLPEEELDREQAEWEARHGQG